MAEGSAVLFVTALHCNLALWFAKSCSRLSTLAHIAPEQHISVGVGSATPRNDCCIFKLQRRNWQKLSANLSEQHCMVVMVY